MQVIWCEEFCMLEAYLVGILNCFINNMWPGVYWWLAGALLGACGMNLIAGKDAKMSSKLC